MEHPKDVGDRSQLAAMLGLRQAGYAIFTAVGENTRADFVIDDGERLFRVQCKTGRLRRGVVAFRACSSYAHHQNPASRARDYLGQIDYFAIYCPETAGVYLVPIKDAALTAQGYLRIDAPRNAQRRRIRYADPYLVATVSFTAGLRESSGAQEPCA